MSEICNMLKHRGEILKSIIEKSGKPLNQIAKKMRLNRSTVYRHFLDPNVSIDYLIQYGKAIDIDMSKYFPEVTGAMMAPPTDYNAPKSYTELQADALYWKDKYIEILEKYNSLLNEQLHISESKTRNNDKSQAS